MSWKFQKEDGSLVDHAWVDGYAVGDRLLEGVMFKITIDEDKKFHAEIDKFAKDYFNDLNEKKWLKAIEKYASSTDIFSENVDGGEDLIVYDTETGEECPNCN